MHRLLAYARSFFTMITFYSIHFKGLFKKLSVCVSVSWICGYHTMDLDDIYKKLPENTIIQNIKKKKTEERRKNSENIVQQAAEVLTMMMTTT